jgi:DNA-binding transcriptional LysR family regulator
MHDLRRLRALHAVAEHGSFSAAALELGYAQSVVSHHVAALENEFGVTLVNRGTRPVTISDAGERLLRHSTAALGHIAAAEDELRAIAGIESGTLRVGAFLSACNSFVPNALAKFESAHPGIDLTLKQMEEQEAVRRLRSGDLDVAVVWKTWGTDEKGEEGFETVLLADDPYRVVMPRTHRLSSKQEIQIADLAGERFNAPFNTGPGAPYRAMLSRVCAAAGFEPDIAYEVDDISVGRAFVAAGLCLGLAPELGIGGPRDDVAVLPVRDIAPFRSVHAAWLKERRVPALSEMVKCLEESARERLGVPSAQRV